MESLESPIFSKEFNGTFYGVHLRDIWKEMKIGNELCCLGWQLEQKITSSMLAELNEINSYLSRIDQADCRLFNWAMQPTMVALVQHRFMNHPLRDVRLAVASCLSEITRITTPIISYTEHIWRQVLQLMVDSLDGLKDDRGFAFGKHLKILELMANTRVFSHMLNLGYDEMIQQLF